MVPEHYITSGWYLRPRCTASDIFDSSQGVHEVHAPVSDEMPFSTLMLEGGLTPNAATRCLASVRAQKHLIQHVASADETWKSLLGP
jgi:hypothetical protein